MKAKIFIIAIVSVVVLLIAVVALWGRQYYTDRYVGADYYAMVPLNYDMAQRPMYSMSGEEIGTGVTYGLTAYDASGAAKVVSFTVYSPESGLSRGEIQPLPGAYLWVSASKRIVLRWRVVEESEVPKNALEKIKGQ